jgi:ubiquinone/menaquinone biosynthesis C-methylase UbiE
MIKRERFQKNNILYYHEDVSELLLKYLAKKNPKTFLDLGCGDGSLLNFLKNKKYLDNKKVYAVDFSKHRIELIKKIDSNFNCYVNDACDITNIKNDSIDFLNSTQLIEHVSSDEKMVKEISRILKKEGIVYLSTVFKKWYGWYFYKCDGKWALHPEHIREYTEDKQLTDLFEKESFKILENKKKLFWFPIIEPIFRKLKIRRNIFENKFIKILRKIKFPIIGYYEWELVLEKN